MHIEPFPTSSENAELVQGWLYGGGGAASPNAAANSPATAPQNAPASGNEPLPSVWREELPYVILAWLSGGLIGGMFLMFAVLSRPMTALPITIILIVGGAQLAVVPGLWITIDVWRDWRRVQKLKSAAAAPPQTP